MVKKMKYLTRVIGEAELVSSHFGTVELDEENPSYIVVEEFDLPLGFNKNYSTLLIDLGADYPLFPPLDFYLDRGLQKQNTCVLEHYFEDGFVDKKYGKQGFAWYSLHIKNWNPDPCSIIDGDNLLTAIEALYNALKTD